MPRAAILFYLAPMSTIIDDRVRSVRSGLLARSAELRDRLQRVCSDFRREREPLPRDAPDAALAMENDEVLEAIERTSARELEHIQAALERIDQGVYGLCAKCGAEIDVERLRAVPYAIHCRTC
jgi:DnaK suppressor protein